ncbi:MAG: hypothetical protein ACRDSF_08140 [Pseudonocardiaceae bacterium]
MSTKQTWSSSSPAERTYASPDWFGRDAVFRGGPGGWGRVKAASGALLDALLIVARCLTEVD